MSAQQEDCAITQLHILKAKERRAYDRPPHLTRDERHVCFNVTADIRRAIGRIETSSSRVGFLVQLGYFRASARFFLPSRFRRRDVVYAQRMLGLSDADLSDYSGAIARRHRETICRILGWHPLDDKTRDTLRAHADSLAAMQEYPQQVFQQLLDICWKRQWVIPAYTDLAEIITTAYNATETRLLDTLDRLLTCEHRTHLDTLLAPLTRPGGETQAAPITYYRRLEQSLRPSDLKRALVPLELFRNLYLLFAPVLDELPLNDAATEYYAAWLTKADRQQLTQFHRKSKTYLYILAFIKDQFYRRQDQAMDVLLKSVCAARQAVLRQLREQDQSRQKARDQAIDALRRAHLSASQFADGVVAITKTENATPSEKYYKIQALVDDYLESQDPVDLPAIEALSADTKRSLRNLPYLERLAETSVRLQRRLTGLVSTVMYDERTSSPALIVALDYFALRKGRLGTVPPCAFLSQQERAAVWEGDRLNKRLFKALLFVHMADALKAGRLNLRYSYRFRAIQDYLIPRAQWRDRKDQILEECGLAEFADGAETMAVLRVALDKRFQSTNERVLSGENEFVAVAQDGRCRVRTPRTDYDTRSVVSATLEQQGIVPILDLLKGVDRVCGFTQSFRHFSTKRSKMSPTPETLMAGVIAYGCNIGLGKLAKISTGLKIDNLRNTVNWFFDQDTLRAANLKITSTIGELALANQYVRHPPVIHSSSDGRKLNVAVECLHAAYSYKYFGKDKGVTDYTFIDERQALFHSQVFSASDREAPYVIDGLVDNRVSEGHVHSTDTHGFTEQIFGVAHLLGVAFAPRLARLHEQRLYGFSARRTYLKKGYVLIPSRTINRRLILEHWDDILRFVATVKSRHTTASQLFKRLSSYARDHPLYRALKEFGRIIKTQFILTYYDDLELRQQIQKQLNLVEQANRFSSAVFFDNDQAFQDGSLQHQELAMSCKQLLQNAIVLWNYLTLSTKVLETRNRKQRQHLVDSIRRGSVMSWAHVNLRGEYAFTPPSANDDVFDIAKIRALRI